MKQYQGIFIILYLTIGREIKKYWYEKTRTSLTISGQERGSGLQNSNISMQLTEIAGVFN
jgi:hypothetical protein